MVSRRFAFLTVFLCCLFLPLVSFGNGDRSVEEELRQAVGDLYLAHSRGNEANLRKSVEELTRIDNVYPDNYLVNYYLGLGKFYQIVASSQGSSGWNSQGDFDEGVGYVKKSIELSPEFADAYVLHAEYLGYNIFVEGYGKARENNRLIEQLLSTAENLSSGNPRIPLARAIQYMSTPEPYGGSLDEAEQNLEQAIRLFETQDTIGLHPVAGLDESYIWSAKLAAVRENPELARQYLEKALEVNPESVWAAHELDELARKDKNGYTVYILLGVFAVLLALLLLLSKTINYKKRS